MPNKKRRILECVNVHFLSRGMVSRLVCAGRMSGASRCQPSHTETSTAEPEPSRAGPSAAALRVPPSTCPSGSTFPYLWGRGSAATSPLIHLEAEQQKQNPKCHIFFHET